MEYHVYGLLKSSCFKLLGKGKYGLLLIQKVNGKIKLTWNFLAFHFLDIPEPRKYDFWCSISALQMTQFAEKIRTRLISQMIKGIARVLQRFPRYFSGTAISTSAVPSLSVFFKNSWFKFKWFRICYVAIRFTSTVLP